MAVPHTYHLVTLGCPKNDVDSEHLERLLTGGELLPVLQPEDADAIIVNTCGFIEQSQAQSMEAVRALAAGKREGQTLIVATEPHIIHQMEKALPEKTFLGAPGADGNCNCNICPYMALNTMEKLYTALRDLSPRIEIEESVRLAARRSVDRMLEMASGTVGLGDLGKFPSGD